MKKIFIGIVVVALIVWAFIYISTPRYDMTGPDVVRTDLHIEHLKLVAGPSVFRARVGNTVMITVSSDQAEELHLHGYDKKMKLAPNKPGMFIVKADRVGTFVVELESSKSEIFTLEVMP
ncbi:MAG: hypothetical protein UY50_C0024G0041 [Parcubacteria group bacterium GW2011_GWA2_49_9]|nr:MAG: hypothetical protein UY50_C0024G0041 [Parcubacteria group bacterium GW2011_GWA2_49_9]